MIKINDKIVNNCIISDQNLNTLGVKQIFVTDENKIKHPVWKNYSEFTFKITTDGKIKWPSGMNNSDYNNFKTLYAEVYGLNNNSLHNTGKLFLRDGGITTKSFNIEVTENETTTIPESISVSNREHIELDLENNWSVNNKSIYNLYSAPQKLYYQDLVKLATSTNEITLRPSAYYADSDVKMLYINIPYTYEGDNIWTPYDKVELYDKNLNKTITLSLSSDDGGAWYPQYPSNKTLGGTTAIPNEFFQLSYPQNYSDTMSVNIIQKDGIKLTNVNFNIEVIDLHPDDCESVVCEWRVDDSVAEIFTNKRTLLYIEIHP